MKTNKKAMVLPLQKTIIYGPIDSRRLGNSLGVNLMPCEYKLCSFDCVYCHYGLTDILSLDIRDYIKDLPRAEKVLNEVEQNMKSSLDFAYITFSGNGEPTLHPDFASVVDGIFHLRNKYRPRVKIALLSNSSGLKIESVRSILQKIDLPVFKLDVGNRHKFQQINRPEKAVVFEEIIELLRQVGNIYIQTVLMTGTPSNIEHEELHGYFEKIGIIKPRAVHIYSLDLPVPNKNIKRVLPEELEKIAKIGSKATGVKFSAYYMEPRLCEDK